jgi:cytochrome b6-f complex iron-sulfur subunit
MEESTRRNFLAVCIGCVGTIVSGLVMYPLYRYLAPRKSAEQQRNVTFAEGEIPPGGAKFFEYHGTTGVIIRKNDGDLRAYSAVCTHLGCIVQWEMATQGFLCPCHAGRYTSDGNVVSGPPPKALEKLPFTLSNGIITLG